MTFPQVVTPERFNRGASLRVARRQVRNSPGFPLKACGNDGLWQCYRPPRRSKLRGIDPKEIKLKQIQKHPRGDYADIFIGFESQKVLVTCYDELRKTFDRGFDVLVIIRIRGNHMKAQISVHR